MFPQSLVIAAEGVNPLGHVVDKTLFYVGGLAFTMHTVTLILSATLTVLVMMHAAKSIASGSEPDGAGRYVPKGKLAQMIETICFFIREKVVQPQLGEATDKFVPFLWTLFFFILFNNVLGLVPLVDLQHIFGAVAFGDSHWAVVGGTATGNLAVTGALAIIAFIVIQINDVRSSGVGNWAKHFLGGAPLYLAPIMVPVEILGMIIKPGALAVRLFANMVAGHTLLATILMFTGMAVTAGAGMFASPGAGIAVVGVPVTIISMAAGVALYFLEIFVAFLQAFIFMFLTTIFIAQLMHHHHDDHEHAHEHDETPLIHDAAIPVTQ